MCLCRGACKSNLKKREIGNGGKGVRVFTKEGRFEWIMRYIFKFFILWKFNYMIENLKV